MKRIHILILLFTLLSCSGFGQQKEQLQDVIYTHDGSIYRGRITSTPGQPAYLISIYGGSTISVQNADVDSITREPAIIVLDKDNKRSFDRKSGRYTRLEACASLLMYTQVPVFPGSPGQYVYGGGFSFMPEFCRPHRNFSFLTGIAAQMMNARNYTYQRGWRSAYGNINRGFQARFEVPFWFRWSWGHRIGMFFQFGASTGFTCYAGQGSEQPYGYPPTPPYYGRLTVYGGFINVSTLGFGIRKELPSHLSFITYIEGAPVNFEFSDNNNPYKPYLQIHAGINFDPKYFIRKKKGAGR